MNTRNAGRKKIPNRVKLTLTLSLDSIELLKKGKYQLECSSGAVVEAALAEFFDPRKEQQRMAAIRGKLTDFDKRLESVQDSTTILAEFLVIFLKTFLMHNPKLPEDVKDVRGKEVTERYISIFNKVAQNLAQEKTIFDTLSQSVKGINADRFTKGASDS